MSSTGAMSRQVDFKDRLHTNDGHSFTVEDLYQAFKQRASLECMPQIQRPATSLVELLKETKS